MDKGLSLKKTKIFNLTTVLKVIRAYGPVSRAEISKRTKLSPTACTDITKALIQSGSVVEVGEGVSSGGRKPILLKINDGFGVVVGVERSGDFIQVRLYDLALNVIDSVNTKGLEDDYKTSFEKIEVLTKQLLEKYQGLNILAMAISVDGIVDRNTHQIIEASHAKGETFSYKNFYKGVFNFPVYVENDSNVLAFAMQKNNYKDCDSLVHMRIDTGIGAGVIYDGKIMRGRNGYVGEIGHITLDRNGPMCYCGSKGCLEMLASRAAIDSKIDYAIQSLRNENLKDTGKDQTGHYAMEEVLAASRAGDVFAGDLLKEEVDLLYHAVIGIINLYDPEVITISGFGKQATGYFVDEIIKKMDGTIYKYQLENRNIDAVDWEDDLICNGAAMFGIEQIFDNNIIAKASV